MNKVFLIITTLILLTSQTCFADYCNLCCGNETEILFCKYTTEKYICTGGCDCCEETKIYSPTENTKACCEGTPYKNGANTQGCCDTNNGKVPVTVQNAPIDGLKHCCSVSQKEAFWDGSRVQCCDGTVATNYDTSGKEIGKICCPAGSDTAVNGSCCAACTNCNSDGSCGSEYKKVPNYISDNLTCGYTCCPNYEKEENGMCHLWDELYKPCGSSETATSIGAVNGVCCTSRTSDAYNYYDDCDECIVNEESSTTVKILTGESGTRCVAIRSYSSSEEPGDPGPWIYETTREYDGSWVEKRTEPDGYLCIETYDAKTGKTTNSCD